jgi:hypothetical protein
MKALNFIPVATHQSSRPEYTELRTQENVLSGVLLSFGELTVRVRTWFYQPSFISRERRFQKRYECYLNGVLIDYSTDRKSIIDTAKWLSN